MKLSELLSRGRPTVSCELFPPKVGTTLDQVEGVLRDTAALRPDFISVTYGAGGSTSKRTQEIAVRLQDTYHVPALAHLTCVSSTREEISSMVAALRAAGIENILALRGDIPRDADFPSPEHYHYASELIGHIRSLEGGKELCIGAACYPEGHVECPHREDDIDFLKRKVDMGVDFLTTQMFFDNNVYYNFLYRVLAVGISQRTEEDSIDALAETVLSESKTFRKLLAFDIPKSRSFMHLDTVFTMVDRDKFTVHPNILQQITVFVMELDENRKMKIRQEDGRLEDILKEHLELDKVTLIPCGQGSEIDAAREQWSDGSNTLAIGPGEVVVYSRNYVTNRALEEAGIRLHTIPSAELSRGRGGPRCMSMPLWREDP